MTRLLVVAAVAIVAVLAAAGVGAGAELHVYPGELIQDAIGDAEPGDTIYVHAGAYIENVDVWKRVTLIGDGVVAVQAANASDHVLEVTADYVNISGFTVTGAITDWWKAGIYLSHANHCSISDNIASNNFRGIDLSHSNNNTLTDNTVNSKSRYGIYLHSSNNNTFASNTFVNDGLFVCSSFHNSVENNTVNGKPLVYLEDAVDYTIANAGQVILVNCNNITVKNLNLSNIIVGIELWETDNSIIIDNTVNSNSLHGIYLYSSSNNMLANNTVNSNDGYGICLQSSSNNMLTNNTVNSNGYGIDMESSSNNMLANNTVNSNNYGIGMSSLSSSSNYNTIYRNNLINTIGNAYDTGTNTWDSGSEGNYWGDYGEKYPDAEEIADSGIWNTPYDIPGDTSTDRYPLMYPWTGDTPQKGDLNHDGNVTPADAAIALRLAVTGAHDDAADVSRDGQVTSLDALMILQAAAGRIEL